MAMRIGAIYQTGVQRPESGHLYLGLTFAQRSGPGGRSRAVRSDRERRHASEMHELWKPGSAQACRARRVAERSGHHVNGYG